MLVLWIELVWLYFFLKSLLSGLKKSEDGSEDWYKVNCFFCENVLDRLHAIMLFSDDMNFLNCFHCAIINYFQSCVVGLGCWFKRVRFVNLSGFVLKSCFAAFKLFWMDELFLRTTQIVAHMVHPVLILTILGNFLFVFLGFI